MNRTLAGFAAALILPAGIAVVVGASPAAAEPLGPPPPGAKPPGKASAAPGAPASPEMLAAMQRDLGLTAAGARNRIAKDTTAARTQAVLRKKLGSAFGGAWLTADAKSFVVAVTDSARAAEVTAAGATPTVVARSAAKLDAVKDKLDKVPAKPPAASVPGWYVDARANTVVVQARGGTDAAEDFIKASGVDASAVRVVATTEQPETLADVRGGDPFYINGKGRCSVGFSINGGFVTAGHCGAWGSATTGRSDQIAQGTIQGSSFPDNDYAWVDVNSDWTPKPWVNNYSGSNVQVAGSTVAPVGAAVCRSGSSSGWHCGTVLALNQTVQYSQGAVYELTRTDVCAEKGDSGGPFISGQQAQGVTSGGSGNCTSGGINYFQPINEILAAADRQLVVSECLEFTTTGSVNQGGSSYQPDNTYYTSLGSGQHVACLDGPEGADFDLYLQKWNGTSWSPVAQSLFTGPDEEVSYSGTLGYYRWRVHAYSGSGSYTLSFSNP